MRSRTYRNRRGITLLFVVSMIVLFLLMGTTFVIVSNDFFKASKKRSVKRVHVIDSPQLVEQAFYDLVRGPELSNRTSPLRAVDLLSDMYGYDGFRAEVSGTPASAVIPVHATNAPTVAPVIDSQDQLIEIEVVNAVNLVDGAAYNFAASIGPGYYNGQVITFVSGIAKGLSTRIYDFIIEDDGATPPNVTARKFIIVAPKWNDGGSIPYASLVGTEVIVNGREFAGFGAGGYSATATEAAAGLGPQALLPNRIGEDLATLTGAGGYVAPFTGPNDTYNGPNESYDAPDFQNPFLAGTDNNGNRIASFHRESLAQYFGDRNPGSATNRHMFSAFPVTLAAGAPDFPVDTDNDGIRDAIWMDPGYTVQSNGNGVFYKPLIAVQVVDLDSRLNLNIHGNRVDMARVVAGGAPQPYAGQGFGPADLSLEGFLNGAEYQALIQGDATRALPGRLGFGLDNVADSGDEVPGAPGRDAWSTKKLFGYPTGTRTVERLYQTSPLDMRGRFSVYAPTTSAYPDPNLAALFNNSLPEMDISTSILTDGLNESPYEANFSPSPFRRWEVGDDDTPFLAVELERLLRPFDVDSASLTSRLADLLPGLASDAVRRSRVTTDSYEVPISGLRGIDGGGRSRPLLDILRAKIRNDGDLTTNPYFNLELFQIDGYLRQLIAPELLRGMKMDINRPLGNGLDDNGNQVIDDPAEIAQTNFDDAVDGSAMDLNSDFLPGTDDQYARQNYARQLYVLMLIAGESENSAMSDEEYKQAVAQWAVNVVDFRDPDSINTPFEYDVNPWNGWDRGADGVLISGEPATGPTGDRRLVWGAERPELLITETFMHHDRALEDLSVDDNGGGTVSAGSDTDFDSRLVPRSSAFIEIYHPWTQSANHQILPPELAEVPAAPTGVDLQKRTPGDSPVWRIAVKRDAADAGFWRSIYFTDLGATASGVTDGGLEFFTTLDVPEITPGVHAVIGSSGNSQTGGGYRTTFGRLNAASGAVEGSAATLLLDDTRSLTLVPTLNSNNNQLVRNEWNNDPMVLAMEETNTRGIAVVIDSPRSLSLSDPDAGYPVDPMINPGSDVGDGYAYNVARDMPLDVEFGNAADLTAIFTNGTIDGFRQIYLQRLANPLLDWDAETNPYLTIDGAQIDLLSFNGVSNDPNNSATDTERDGAAVVNGDTDFGSTERGESQTDELQLFARDSGNPAAEGISLAGADSHNFSYQFNESFGQTNDAYVNATAGTFYAWLNWNNRPFMNQYELANVPYVSQEMLTARFSVRDSGRDPYTTPGAIVTSNDQALASRFGHLLNFYGYDNTAANPQQPNFYRLFDFTEVPSRYVGTENWANPLVFVNAPFNFFSNYRYPGKININTVSNEVYARLMGDYAATTNYATFADSRWKAAAGSQFFRPYRNTAEGNFVPTLTSGTLVEENVDCGLMRRNATGDCLFDNNLVLANADPNRSAYYQNAMRQRLGNLVTTRSSVFAIWITVGYFQVDESGALVNQAGGGVELGSDTGEVTRNRGFFIFDRSIPVAFEPGKNHNVDRAILLKSIIE